MKNSEESEEITVDWEKLHKGDKIKGQLCLVGNTYVIKNSSGKALACKTVSKDEAPNFKELYERENLAWIKLQNSEKKASAWRHAGILEMFQVMLLDAGYMVTTDLYIKNMLEFTNQNQDQMNSFPVATCCLRQMFLAVGFLHRHGIYQRQLSLGNFAITRYVKEDDKYNHIRIAIGDFSRSTSSSLDETPMGDEYIGVYEAMPPEIATKMVKNEPLWYDLALAETWQLGILMYYVSHSQYPFKCIWGLESLIYDQKSRSRSKLLQTRFRQPSDDESQWVYIFRKLFSLDVNRRYSLIEIYRSGRVEDIIKGECPICGI